MFYRNVLCGGAVIGSRMGFAGRTDRLEIIPDEVLAADRFGAEAHIFLIAAERERRSSLPGVFGAARG